MANLQKARNMISLNDIGDNFSYTFSKMSHNVEKEKGVNNDEFYANAIKVKINDLASISCIHSDQLSENLFSKQRKHVPKFFNTKTTLEAQKIVNPKIPIVMDIVTTLKTLCKFTALEIFYHPGIRKSVIFLL